MTTTYLHNGLMKTGINISTVVIKYSKTPRGTQHVTEEKKRTRCENHEWSCKGLGHGSME